MTLNLKEHLDKDGIETLRGLIESLEISKISIDEDGYKTYDQESITLFLLETVPELKNILDAVCNIKENPPEIPRLDQIELKINEIIDWLISQGCTTIEKLPG